MKIWTPVGGRLGRAYREIARAGVRLTAYL